MSKSSLKFNFFSFIVLLWFGVLWGCGVVFCFYPNCGVQLLWHWPLSPSVRKCILSSLVFPSPPLLCGESEGSVKDRKSTITTLCESLSPGCLKSVMKMRLGYESYWRRAVAETCIGYSSEQNDQRWGMIVAGQFYQWKSHFLKWNRMGVKKQSRAYPGKESGYSWECEWVYWRPVLWDFPFPGSMQLFLL